ncbi:MAG TPA: YceI family protein [Microthrixaceae bacterium]|nr:YceI family protein [Microthrixaceae bacterium]
MTATQTARTYDGTAVPTAGTYAFDVSHSNVGFSARHLVVAKVRGSFTDFDGSLVVAENPLESSIDVSIDAASVQTRDEQRDGHLRGADFLDVDRHPRLTYRSTGVRHVRGDRWEVNGELTVHGVTREVPLSVTFEGSTADPWGNSRAVFSATAKLNREDFGLTWNQALETGGVLVGKDITIEIEVEAVLQAS